MVEKADLTAGLGVDLMASLPAVATAPRQPRHDEEGKPRRAAATAQKQEESAAENVEVESDAPPHRVDSLA
jgi:hypothetical protein